jgi:hypothetical protein
VAQRAEPAPAIYHSSLSTAVLERIRARTRAFRFAALINLDRELSVQTKDYLTLLSHRYVDQGLRIAFLRPIKTPLLDIVSTGLPVLYDLDVATLTGHRVSAGRNAMILINEDGRVEFYSADLPQADSLRQVIEKSVLDHIDYSTLQPKAIQVFRLSSTLPQITIASIAHTERMTLTKVVRGPATVVILTGRCNECQLTQYVAAIADLDSQRPRGRQLVLLFTEAYSKEPEVLARLNSDIRQQVYQIVDDSYDPYVTRLAKEALTPFVAEVNESGRIVRAYPLSSETSPESR